jgi:signal transduction histidine kinase
VSIEGPSSPLPPAPPTPAPFVDRRKWIHKQLEAVRLLSETLFQHTKVDALVAKALETALEVLKAEAGSVLLADPATKQLVFHHSIGASPVPYGTAIPWDKGIAGSVFQSGKPAVINEVKKDIRHYTGIDSSTGYETRNMVTLPLKRWEGEPIGVMNVLNKREGGLYDDDVATLTVISAITAAAIEQARLFEEAKLAEVVRLLGDIGHDIKNMITPVVMGASIVESDLKDLLSNLPAYEASNVQALSASCDEALKMQRRAATRIQDRMREIADCVKGLSAPPQFAPCMVAEVVASVREILDAVVEAKHITLCTENLEALPTIEADERRLYNAIYNLINNAISEVPEGGSITVRGQEDAGAGSIIVSVIDTGQGMPPEVRDSLFTARAISRKPGGTGLGTKIVKDVVDAHSGQITVESEEGVGTTFHLRFPIHH